MVVHSIERFASAPSVESIIAVLPSQHVTELGGLDVPKPVRIVSGGATRVHSVANGLGSVDTGVEIVAVHDGGFRYGYDQDDPRW
jgi:2-C-methyl-D-erythritol 4-phosphate cytidylyltransferase